MIDNEITREKTFSEELPYFKERMKEVFDYYDNPKGCAEMLYIDVLRDSNRIVRKAEEEITRQQTEIERLQNTINDILDRQPILVERAEKYAKSDAIKGFAEKLKNKIKTECNPYGKPTCDYGTGIEIMRYIDNLVKEIVNNEKG